MSTIEEQAAQAANGIKALRYLAARGDAAAATELLAVAVDAAGHVAALHDFPEEKNVMATLAATARQWPVNFPAIQELQPRALAGIPAGLGSDLPFRVAKGATKLRVFHGNTGPQLALTAFHEMEKIRTETPESDKQAYRDLWHMLPERMKEDWRILAALLPPLDDSPASVSKWKEAGTRWAEYQCQGQWKAFPWPAEVMNRAEQKTNSRKRGIETAVKEILERGFSGIARPLPLIPPR
jgi:hypothetical protein